MRISCTIVVCLFANLVSAQFLSHVSPDKVDGMFVNWTKGQMLFDTGDSINCDIRFDQLNQNMDVRYQGVDLEIPFADITSFNFYDSAKRRSRYFEKVVVQSGKVVLMEYLFKSKKASLLEERFIRKFHMAYRDPLTLDKREFRITMPVEKKFLYNAVTKDALLMSRSNLLIITKDKAREMRKFIDENRLRLETDDDFIVALKHYDLL
jgi:hypothetical protein